MALSALVYMRVFLKECNQSRCSENNAKCPESRVLSSSGNPPMMEMIRLFRRRSICFPESFVKVLTLMLLCGYGMIVTVSCDMTMKRMQHHGFESSDSCIFEQPWGSRSAFFFAGNFLKHDQ